MTVPASSPTVPRRPAPSRLSTGRLERPAASTLFAASEGVWPKLLLGLLMALLFYLPNQAQFRLETGVRALNVPNVLFLLTLGVTWLTHRASDDRTPLKWPLLLFVLTLTWALFVALRRDSSAWVQDLTIYKNAVFYPLLFFLYYHAVRDRKTVRILVLLTLFVVLTSGILGLRQALDYGIATFNEHRRVSAPFGWALADANRAAVFFCILLQPVAAAVLFLKSRRWLRLVCAIVFALGVFVVFHTYSRQAYGILALTTLLIALRRHLVLATLVAVALVNYPLWVPDTVVQRIEMTVLDPFEGPSRRPPPAFDPLAELGRPWVADPDRAGLARSSAPAAVEQDGPQFDGSTESRFLIWEGAWELIQQQPMGIGLNRFQGDIGAHVPADLAGKDAHNFYVLLATEAGVVAPGVLVALLLALLLLGYRLAQVGDDEECRALGVGFMMATVAVILGNVYGSRFIEGDVMGNYWILAALVARTTRLEEHARRERLRPPATPAFGRARRPRT